MGKFYYMIVNSLKQFEKQSTRVRERRAAKASQHPRCPLDHEGSLSMEPGLSPEHSWTKGNQKYYKNTKDIEVAFSISIKIQPILLLFLSSRDEILSANYYLYN